LERSDDRGGVRMEPVPPCLVYGANRVRTQVRAGNVKAFAIIKEAGIKAQ
jgi:hypothetical protein